MAKYCFGVWLSLVECLVRDQEVARSNRVTPTISSVHNESDEHSIFFAYILLFGAGLSALFCYAVVGR